MPTKLTTDFLDAVCKEIRYRGIHASVRKELNDHIEDQWHAYLAEGMEKEEAIRLAVKQMGDPLMVGKQLDHAHRPKTEWSILLIVGIFIMLSGVMQFFFSQLPDSREMLTHFLIYAPVGIAVFMCIYFFDYTWLAHDAKMIYLILIILMVAGFLLFSKVNGSYNYLTYGALLFMPTFAGLVYSYRNRGYIGIIFCSLGYVVGTVIISQIPSFSGAILFLLCSILILHIAVTKGVFGVNRKIGILLSYVPAVMLLSIWFLALTRQSMSLSAWLNSSNFSKNEYILAAVRHLFTNAKPFGEVSGQIEYMPLHRVMPIWSTDLSLTYLIATLGYVPGIVLVFALFVFMIRMLLSVLKQKNIFSFLISFSIYVALAGQIILYVFSNIGVMQPMAITLPFISYGAIGFIVNMALLGLFLSVHRRTNLVSRTI